MEVMEELSPCQESTGGVPAPSCGVTKTLTVQLSLPEQSLSPTLN